MSITIGIQHPSDKVTNVESTMIDGSYEAMTQDGDSQVSI